MDSIEIRSFGFSTPGLLFNAKKFSVNLADLRQTAVIVRPEYDAASSIDVHIGSVHDVACVKNEFLGCHQMYNSICSLMTHCDVYRAKNPRLADAFCKSRPYLADRLNDFKLLQRR